jgi:hypothetical protein
MQFVSIENLVLPGEGTDCVASGIGKLKGLLEQVALIISRQEFDLSGQFHTSQSTTKFKQVKGERASSVA